MCYLLPTTDRHKLLCRLCPWVFYQWVFYLFVCCFLCEKMCHFILLSHEAKIHNRGSISGNPPPPPPLSFCSPLWSFCFPFHTFCFPIECHFPSRVSIFPNEVFVFPRGLSVSPWSFYFPLEFQFPCGVFVFPMDKEAWLTFTAAQTETCDLLAPRPRTVAGTNHRR